MGMYKNMQDILKAVRFDEELLRLLYYNPEDYLSKTLDPLDERLPNILDMDLGKQWEIRDERIMITPKDDDLTNKRICRIFVYFGDRFPLPQKKSYLIASQDIVVDVLCHADFENKDIRSTRIGDRLNQIFALSDVTGMGKMEYVRGRVLTRTPSQYVGFQHIYRFGSTKQ
ncbi:hypothetical protein [Siminovitchia fordii]|uniref:Uncharacterized protein n=1 Tax=Siminovitchia fordii TaxID=254759 RepID=A0ABQ4KBL5_9BACI|nr:hypothetical protein [Siminovitchia fordii]GIN23112.1 hypothetical protein J1TS3_42460 [Siminovitchia fordii]